MRESGPGRTHLGTCRYDQEHWQPLDCPDQAIEELKRAGVGPMYILQYDKRWLLPGHTLDLAENSGKGPRLPLLRREGFEYARGAAWNRNEICQEGDVLRRSSW